MGRLIFGRGDIPIIIRPYAYDPVKPSCSEFSLHSPCGTEFRPEIWGLFNDCATIRHLSAVFVTFLKWVCCAARGVKVNKIRRLRYETLVPVHGVMEKPLPG
jgi:hypothetical protein